MYFSGLAIAADKTMYIADGTNIRSVDPDGIIHTLIGHHRHHNVWQPIPCKGAIPAQQVCKLFIIIGPVLLTFYSLFS